MPTGAFDRLVRQSMQVNFELFLEAPSAPPRVILQVSHQLGCPDQERSGVVAINPVALLDVVDAEQEWVEPQTVEQVIALVHSENVQDWNRAILQYFASQPYPSMPFLE